MMVGKLDISGSVLYESHGPIHAHHVSPLEKAPSLPPLGTFLSLRESVARCRSV